ncbi:MAG: hypothetical protein V2A58_05285 [Planctomycetota bacterium]
MRELKQNWKDIFGGFKLAFDLWKIVLAFAGIALTVLVHVIVNSVPVPLVTGIFGVLVALALLYALFNMLNRASKPVSPRKTAVFFLLALAILVVTAVLAYGSAKSGAVKDAVKLGIAVIFVLAIWSLFGGAITRIAAVEIATDDRIGLSEAFRFACRKYKEYILAPVLAVAFIAFLALLIWIGMIVSSIPVLGTVLLILIIFPLVILAGFIITLVLIGLVFGFQLMWPTISAEGSDSFDALSRAYSYVFSRPWKYIWYNLVVVLYALACIVFVSLFFRTSVRVMERAGPGLPSQIEQVWPHVYSNVSHALGYAQEFGRNDILRFGQKILYYASAPGEWVATCAERVLGSLGLPDIGPKEPLSWHQSWAKYVMSIGLYLYTALFAAFVFSLVFSLRTMVYFLLRKDVDGTEMTEVFIEEEEEEKPEAAGFDAEGESASSETTQEKEDKPADEGTSQES